MRWHGCRPPNSCLTISNNCFIHVFHIGCRMRGGRHPASRPPAHSVSRTRMARKRLVFFLLVVLIAAGAYYVVRARPADLVLTGIVTTHDVIVSPQIGGQIGKLLVTEGETVTQNQLLAV